ncbi:hypothetical protein DR950_34315 [Kitasatospora xanthocidica]|uniref:Guanylate cyclase domain-containing protein n=1 Tax=Kitasatospora xanthocidica TaxID=83382 RepID=A0A373A204_9ACTN|nr:hypothetical protein [Kitasatospora xanthocidica]RGD62153.1 hypothetical protein DR950_34315 [Kitasatospora xanthocidica]
MSKTTAGVTVLDHAVDAVYKLVVSVDVRRSGAYDDASKTRMRRRLYAVIDQAFTEAAVPVGAVHREDRGDGILAALGPGIAPARILGVWVTEVHEQLRQLNAELATRLGLRIALHVGPVMHDAQGISGHAVDLACRLADAEAARRLLDRDRADLVVVVSDSLYREVVCHGGRFVDPEDYAPARLRLKDGATPAWVRLPGRPRPAPLPDDGGPEEPGSDGPPDNRPAGPPGPAPGAAPGGADDTLAAPHAPGGVYVGGDASNNEGNVYHGPVHIGRTVRGTYRA